ATKTRTGTGHYAANLAAALMQLDHEHELVIYCDTQMLDWFADRRNGHKVALKGITFSSAAQRVFWEQARLSHHLRTMDVNLLHSMAFTSPLMGRTRSVVTVHDLTFVRYPETLPLSKRIYYQSTFKSSLRRAEKIITISESMRQEIVSTFGLDSEDVIAIPIAAGEEFFTPPDRDQTETVLQGLGVRMPYLLTVATLEPRKNLTVLLQAFDLLKRESDLPHKLVLTGKRGWFTPKNSLVEKILGTRKDIIFTGYVPQQDMPALYAGADLFLFPSLYEGFGIPLLEAFATEVPVIGSDIPVHREVCGDAAMFVNPRDHAQWSNAILNLLNDTQKRKQLKAKGMKRLNDFSWKKTAERTLEVYGMDEANGKN
ncbi:glycosyltransferase family 4 protein, partial [candidate division KSB1 bacterium]|nr:glycosyltransferase family 4 protein [candidate division KSB1 bacterium]NIR72882.1 glycosyltransferase family 4 protein [candidate division KSB1 bacterium]NIS25269.1 glycosyltransferase family 4 protein [candidate division KSB1 bacterium]NIT72173.1 glycosyltransferase family 4 protein [candidate division KSB1 bacterium]NIU25978.1 glycosyltransferase family 4 protein [candidate division KSB1 bacterium]